MTPPMNPHQKPQDDAVEVSATAVGAIESLTRRVVFAEPTVLTNEHIAAFSTGQPVPGAVDEPKLIGALMGPDNAYARGYEAGRRDMREAAGKVCRKSGTVLRLAVGHDDEEGRSDRWYDGAIHISDALASEIEALPADPLGGEG